MVLLFFRCFEKSSLEVKNIGVFKIFTVTFAFFKVDKIFFQSFYPQFQI